VEPRDTLFRERAGSEPFVFDRAVARVFPDMIRRSVPGYGLMLEMSSVIAGAYASDDSLLFDLGCALGDSAAALRAGCRGRRCRIVAVDNAPAMIARCRDRFPAQEGAPPVDLVCADIRDIRVTDASVVTLNLTLQFLPHSERLPLLRAVRHGMKQGAALLLSEKVCFEDRIVGDRLADLHTAFKLRQGYSALEVARKREALDDVLVPDTVEQHIHRLHLAGFARVMLWFQCLNFASMLAIR